MSRDVLVQPEAQEDVRSILSFIAEDSISGALKVGARLEHAILQLGTAALHYPLVGRYRAAGIRRRAVGAYNIYFRVTDTRVDVLRVVHSARDITRLLPEGDD